MPPIIFHNRMRTHPISSTHNHHHYDFSIHLSGPYHRDTTYIAPIELKIPNHKPSTYFDVITFTTDTYHIAVIGVIAINMSAPTREQYMAAPIPGRIVTGVNGTGPNERVLRAAAVGITAAEQEARERAASAARREAVRENERLAKKKMYGDMKSLLRRGGSKIASVFKREQEKMS